MDDTLHSPTVSGVTEFPFFGEADVRTALADDGTVWMAAIDVFETLGLTWKGRGSSLPKMPESWVSTLKLRGLRGEFDVIFISEPAVHRVLFRSNKPQAIDFANWVCGTVLPAIRKHGAFGALTAKDEVSMTRTLMLALKQLDETKDAFTAQMLIGRIRRLSQMLHEPMPDVGLIGSPVGQLKLGQS